MSVPLYHRVSKSALILAFSASAGSFFFQWFLHAYWETPLRYLSFAFYAPAVLLGSWSLLRVRSFASSWPVIASMLLALIAISWGERSETGRGVAVFCNLAVILPISSLIVEMNYREMCARTFLIVSAATLAYLFYLHYKEDPYLVNVTLGYLKDGVERKWLSNRNAVGSQMALAILLSIGFCFSRLRTKHKGTSTSRLTTLFSIPVTLFFVFGTILTQSRMALVAVFLPSYMIVFHSKGFTQRKIAVVIVLIVIFTMIPFTKIAKEIGAVSNRFTDVEELLTLGERTEIWQDVWPILTSDPKHLLIGAGTGSVDKEIGGMDIYAIGVKLGEDGITRRSVHSAFFEWLLSYGLLGFMLGSMTLYATLKRAWVLDRRHRTAYRRALVLFCLLISMAIVIYRYAAWPAFGSYLLAILTDRTTKRTPRNSEVSSC